MAAQGTSDRGDARPPAPTKVNAKPPVSVERLTHQDIPEICALYKRVWEQYRPELPAEMVKSWAPTPLEFTSWMEGVTYFAARREGRMIGAVGCEINDGSCRVVNLAVDPDARRQGIGSQLAVAAVDWAKHNNSNSVWVDALARFSAAAAMFKQLEFAEAGVLHRHRWKEDVRLFEKLL
ncbi:MAG TPA: GNAT family N-acetyltransferase [Thermoplasmata archaeon]|nr:GNAT family N-acetyltransferase [Thermoplasmata archaeon]